jgi:isopentenyl-diphosphate Delta-isomerase
MQQVVLVDEKDREIGVMEKMAAHETGSLHRAFSIFIFNRKGELLLQQRSEKKYHGALLWSNTCCSHPAPGENTADAAIRRLKEELGFETAVKKIFDFVYRSPVENGLIEHEFDHVFAGLYEGVIDPDPSEVAAFRYSSMKETEEELYNNREKFSTWFYIVFPRIKEWWASQDFPIGYDLPG